MRTLHVHHVKDSLSQDFTGLIDLSDLTGSQRAQSDTVFLSRALAARAVQRFTGCTLDEAAAAVTDGFHDKGSMLWPSMRKTAGSSSSSQN